MFANHSRYWFFDDGMLFISDIYAETVFAKACVILKTGVIYGSCNLLNFT